MGARCGELLTKIVADADRRQAILADPRDLHRELFAPFAPSTHTDYASTYRGTPGTALADRRMYAASQIDLGTEYEFGLPGEVPPRMVELLKNTHALLGKGSADDYGKLVALTYSFAGLGKSILSWTATVTFSVRSLLRWQRTLAVRSPRALRSTHARLTACSPSPWRFSHERLPQRK